MLRLSDFGRVSVLTRRSTVRWTARHHLKKRLNACCRRTVLTLLPPDGFDSCVHPLPAARIYRLAEGKRAQSQIIRLAFLSSTRRPNKRPRNERRENHCDRLNIGDSAFRSPLADQHYSVILAEGKTRRSNKDRHSKGNIFIEFNTMVEVFN